MGSLIVGRMREGVKLTRRARRLGGVKEMRLDAFAEAFNKAGYWVVVFDYRFFGASSGKPRQLLDINKELEDWHAVIKYARSELETADTGRVVLFGTSFSGGLVLDVAARDGKVAAVISQCPFTSGLRSALCVAPLTVPKLMFNALRDQFFSTADEAVTVKLAGTPSEVALLNSPDSLDYRKLVPQGTSVNDQVSARTALWILTYYPGRFAKDVKAPLFFAICDRDSVAPAGPTTGYAKQAPQGTIKHYDCGHFDIYLGEWFERAMKDYLAFLDKNVPVTRSRM